MSIKKNEGGKAAFYRRIQHRIPKIRKERGQQEPAKGMRDRRLLWGIAAVAIVIVVLVILWAYSISQPKPERTVTDSNVRMELERLQGVNSEPKKINPADYPKTFGIYARNNLTLVEQYFCSDVCPDYGRVNLVFQGIDSEECANIGGKALHDLAWGGYIGCEPRVE
ncbi:MAG: hypothetical protein NTY20_05850 [Candidatus Aenigmarchaeota archaeon]|nr:hypothetical protein [Candidatus Aenigmarchaeota archaeon]